MSKSSTRIKAHTQLKQRCTERGINPNHISPVDELICELIDELKAELQADAKRTRAKFSRYEPKRKESV